MSREPEDWRWPYWTEQDVRARLVDMAETLKRLRFPVNGAPTKRVTVWPEVLRPYWEEHNNAKELGEDVRNTLTRLNASAAQIERMDEVLPWLFYVKDPRHRAVVVLRAMDYSWRRIAERVGICSHETARYWERAAVTRIAESLNRADKKDLTKSGSFDRMPISGGA